MAGPAGARPPRGSARGGVLAGPFNGYIWTIRLAVLVTLALGALYWDLRARRVPNALTYSCALAGLLLGGLERGVPGFVSSGAGLLLAGGIFFPFVIRGLVGAGDMKLLAASGALLGPVGALRAVLLGAVLGGVWALGWMAARGRERWFPYAPPLAAGAVASYFIG